MRLLFLISFLIITVPSVAKQDVNSQRQQEIEELTKRLSLELEPSHRADNLVQLAQLMVEVNLDESYTYANLALDIYRKEKNPLGLGKSHYVLALISTDLGEFDQTDSLLQVAEHYFTDTDDKVWIAAVRNAYGKLYFVQGNYWLAGDNFLKAAQYHDSVSDTMRMVSTYVNLVNTLGEAKNFDQAIRTAAKLLPMVQQMNDKILEGYIWYGLILHYSRLGKYDSAAQYLPSALSFADISSDKYISGYLYGVAGQYYMMQERYAEAIPLFKKAHETFSLSGVQRAIAEYNVWLGYAFVKNGNYSEAKHLLESGLHQATSLRINPIKALGYEALSTYYAGINQSEFAYSFLQKHLWIKDSIYSQESTQYNTYLETTFQTAQKEQKIAQLNLVNTKNENEILSRNRFIWVGGLSAAALLIIMGLLYRNSSQKHLLAEKEKALNQQQIGFLERQQQVVALQSMVNGQEAERNRIAKDLHDGLGGLFSAIKMHFSSLKHQVPTLGENELFNRSLEMADTASSELRRIAHNLMPEVLMKIGLVQALNDLAQNMSSGKLLKVYILAYGIEQRLPATTEVMLYRIVQELLHNIIKHANASEAHVQLNLEGNHLLMTIEDNGIGFDTGKVYEKSAGMQTIQQRVEYLNGKLSIESRQFEGTTVIVDLRI